MTNKKETNMEALTVEALHDLCIEQILKGNKDKKIIISADDEGNDYHELFHSFSEPEKIFGRRFSPCLPHGVKEKDLENYVVLG